MSRINLLLAIAVAGSVVGCAQCDTCDDFPAPCTGPNCGQNAYTPPGYVAPTMGTNSPVMGPASGPTGGPVNDAAPAGPSTPAPGEAMPQPTTPPTPTEPATPPGV